MAKTITNVSELGKEEIGNLYILDIQNPTKRKMHTALLEARSGPAPVPPSTHDMGIDFNCWYGGFLALANALDPGVNLPPAANVIGYITQNFEKVKTSLAA